jgi:NAD(P)-dependent dehydrogenase (short-subunit alcohol dehydrogenase family)
MENGSNSQLLAGRSIVVTGATRGLGRSIATALARAGAQLVINGRDAERLNELAATLTDGGATVVAVPGSVAEEPVAQAIVATAVERFGRLDTLINNAGVVRDRTTLRMTVEEFDDVIATNLRGTWLCGREAARAMKESGGHIINIVSNVAFHGSVGQSNYAASKAGAASLARSWSYEMARYGIRANSVWPVAVTDMTQVVIDRAGEIADAEGRERPTAGTIGLGDPDEVAKLIVYLSSDLASHINNQVITFNGERLALWSHPREVDVVEREHWTVEDLAGQLGGPDGLEQQPMYEPALQPLHSGR